MSCKCSLEEKLEAERFDVSFREPVLNPKQQLANARCNRKHITEAELEAQEKLMFNAGRFSAGARDSVAVSANQKLFEGYAN
jgi:hypothetical protein